MPHDKINYIIEDAGYGGSSEWSMGGAACRVAVLLRQA
jgi:hypothetical protein